MDYNNAGGFQQQNYGNNFMQPNYGMQQPPTIRPSLRPSIPGRLVSCIEEVMPNEVPMDGNISLFIKNDYSCIYAKAWNSDGTITTVRFLKETEQTNDENSFNNQVLERLDKLEEMLTQNIQNRGNSTRSSKKEDAKNE